MNIYLSCNDRQSQSHVNDLFLPIPLIQESRAGNLISVSFAWTMHSAIFSVMIEVRPKIDSWCCTLADINTVYLRCKVRVFTSTAITCSAAVERFKYFRTPSALPCPSISGKKLKYSKPPPKPKSLLDWHPVVSQTESIEFQLGLTNVKIRDDKVSYVVDGVPFEFRYSYMETPNAKLVKMCEAQFVPFRPATMSWLWTRRTPVPPCKTTVKDFHLLALPLDGEEVEPVLLPGPVLERRKKILGRDGVTHNMLETIHIKDVQDKKRTGGKVIYRQAVYPRPVKRDPEGLTLKKATDMHLNGRNLIPVRKLAKNGVSWDLVANVKEAFEECELVRINCQGLNTGDYRKIEAKLKIAFHVYCLHLKMTTCLCGGDKIGGPLYQISDDGEEANKINIDFKNSNTLPSDSQELSAQCLLKNPIEHLSNEPGGTIISS
ncbi:hypothetical protein VNO77_25234 [Canavalia gladiata]|uniref:CRM domain-containing protein n=1 Tax=Canavalia gladiata TaxID=3824 RepID=A0AAN9QAQ7_CANGL